jgi:hypothetical protein
MDDKQQSKSPTNDVDQVSKSVMSTPSIPITKRDFVLQKLANFQKKMKTTLDEVSMKKPHSSIAICEILKWVTVLNLDSLRDWVTWIKANKIDKDLVFAKLCEFHKLDINLFEKDFITNMQLYIECFNEIF